MIAVDLHRMTDGFPQQFIPPLQFFDGQGPGQQDEANSVGTEENAFIAEGVFQNLNHLMNDQIAKFIAPHLVDRGKMSEADHHDVGSRLLGIEHLQVFKQAELILQIRQRIDKAFQAVVVDGAHKVVRRALVVGQDGAPAGAYHIPSLTILDPVLHVMPLIRAGENGGDAFRVALPVIGVQEPLPELAGVEHILSREVKAGNCIR